MQLLLGRVHLEGSINDLDLILMCGARREELLNNGGLDVFCLVLGGIKISLNDVIVEVLQDRAFFGSDIKELFEEGDKIIEDVLMLPVGINKGC